MDEEKSKFKTMLDPFCEDLISKAGFSYVSRHIKKEYHAKYYSHDDKLKYSAITKVNKDDKNDLANYLEDYTKFCNYYLHSRPTVKQAKRVAKSFFKTYQGSPGDQDQFENYFEECLLDLLETRHMALKAEEYVSDSSDASDEGDRPIDKSILVGHPKPYDYISDDDSSDSDKSDRLLTEVTLAGHPKPYDYISDDDSSDSDESDRPLTEVTLVGHRQPYHYISDDESSDDEILFGAFVLNPAIPNPTLPQPESCQKPNASSFSFQRAAGKRVRFFDRDSTEVIDLEHKSMLTL